MKILYRQTDPAPASFGILGITDCYYKLLSMDTDRNVITKPHHHTEFELHMITQGAQYYESGETEYKLTPGTLLLIPPGICHRVLSSAPGSAKTSITFRLSKNVTSGCVFSRFPENLNGALTFIQQEAALNRSLSRRLIENRIFEIIVSVLRLAGLEEAPAQSTAGEHSAISLSRQYIADNIENPPTVTEVAQYCNLSTKQLVRLFREAEGISPGAYILRARTKHIEALISDTGLTLGQISERMHFSSEYYFSAFFKKQAGMPPGEYRRMHGK